MADIKKSPESLKSEERVKKIMDELDILRKQMKEKRQELDKPKKVG